MDITRIRQQAGELKTEDEENHIRIRPHSTRFVVEANVTSTTIR